MQFYYLAVLSKTKRINAITASLHSVILYPYRFIITIIIIFFAHWYSYFIPRGLEISKVKICVWNGYDGDSETVNELARHTALKR